MTLAAVSSALILGALWGLYGVRENLALGAAVMAETAGG